jgi:hypothetical protein
VLGRRPVARVRPISELCARVLAASLVQHANQQTCCVAVTNRGPLPQLDSCGLVSSPIQQLHQVVCAGLVTVDGALPQFCDLLHTAALVQNLNQPCRRIHVAAISSGPQFGYRIGIAPPGKQFD